MAFSGGPGPTQVKTISDAWNALDADGRKESEAEAKDDKRRYDMEFRKWEDAVEAAHVAYEAQLKAEDRNDQRQAQKEDKRRRLLASKMTQRKATIGKRPLQKKGSAGGLSGVLGEHNRSITAAIEAR
jgi:hypothetical protein